MQTTRLTYRQLLLHYQAYVGDCVAKAGLQIPPRPVSFDEWYNAEYLTHADKYDVPVEVDPEKVMVIYQHRKPLVVAQLQKGAVNAIPALLDRYADEYAMPRSELDGWEFRVIPPLVEKQ